MKKILFIFLFLSQIIQAQIVEIKHFNEIESHLMPGTLIVFDIDDTLLIPVQMMGCDEWFKTRLSFYQAQGCTKSESLERSLAEWEAVRHLTKMEIVEPGTDEIVRKLQERGYAVMGLTTQGLALATRTKQQLCENQIDLTQTAPSDSDHYLTVDGHCVLFRRGILFTSGSHKGKALFGLLNDMCVHPKRIIFVNDKHTHLVQVEQIADKKGVEFIGLRYAYSDAKKAAFDKDLAEYQFSHSTFTHILSDDEAKAQY